MLNFLRIFLFIHVFAIPVLARKEPQVLCDICDTNRRESWVKAVPAQNDGTMKNVCILCANSKERCYICKLPIARDEQRLEDGRVFCRRDFNEGVFDEREAQRIAYETTRELTRVFYRFGMKFPETNVVVSIVSPLVLHDRTHQPYDPTTTSIMGLTETLFFDAAGSPLSQLEALDADNKKMGYIHRISLVSGLSKKRMLATCAHELGHAWLHENISPKRLADISKETEEGFCELVAYQLMDSQSEAFEKTQIKQNLYTRGQQNVLIEADLSYGFYKVLKWFDEGMAAGLNNADFLQKTLREEKPVAAQTQALQWQPPTPIVLPDTILLKGLLGTGNKRIAMINNASLMEGEKTTIKLAKTNATVQCIKILEKSVTVKINDEERELFLHK